MIEHTKRTEKVGVHRCLSICPCTLASEPVVHANLTFALLRRVSASRLAISSMRAGMKEPGPRTSGRSAASSEAMFIVRRLRERGHVVSL